MNTATQLLERLKFLCTGSEDPDLYKDIEAYLAKQPVETLKPLGTIYRWTALKDGRLIYQYSDQGYPELFKKSVVTLPTEPEQQVEQEPFTATKALHQRIEYLKRLSDNGLHMNLPSTMSSGACLELALELERLLPISSQSREPIGTVRQANGCTYVEWNHVPPEAGTVCYAAPKAREPMSEQEPVAQYSKELGDFGLEPPDGFDSIETTGIQWQPLYTSSQAREPLSDDAKRYQYLRNRPLDTITSGGIFAGMTPENIVLNGVDLDEHIDAAIEAHHNIK